MLGEVHGGAQEHVVAAKNRAPDCAPTRHDAPVAAAGRCSRRESSTGASGKSAAGGPSLEARARAEDGGDTGSRAGDDALPPLSVADERRAGPTLPAAEKMAEGKRVSFADQCGLDLSRVRQVAERSDEPPSWTPDTIGRILAGVEPGRMGAETGRSVYLAFAQPASDRARFERRLREQNVSLESVLVSARALSGTVGVRNVDFHKRVFVRYTTNEWATSVDQEATFLASRGPTVDTFAFEVPCAARVRRLAFAVCFESCGRQFWDSNDGHNYLVVVSPSRDAPASSPVVDSFARSTGYQDWPPNWQEPALADTASFHVPYW